MYFQQDYNTKDYEQVLSTYNKNLSGKQGSSPSSHMNVETPQFSSRGYEIQRHSNRNSDQQKQTLTQSIGQQRLSQKGEENLNFRNVNTSNRQNNFLMRDSEIVSNLVGSQKQSQRISQAVELIEDQKYQSLAKCLQSIPLLNFIMDQFKESSMFFNPASLTTNLDMDSPCFHQAFDFGKLYSENQLHHKLLPAKQQKIEQTSNLEIESEQTTPNLKEKDGYLFKSYISQKNKQTGSKQLSKLNSQSQNLQVLLISLQFDKSTQKKNGTQVHSTTSSQLGQTPVIKLNLTNQFPRKHNCTKPDLRKKYNPPLRYKSIPSHYSSDQLKFYLNKNYMTYSGNQKWMSERSQIQKSDAESRHQFMRLTNKEPIVMIKIFKQNTKHPRTQSYSKSPGLRKSTNDFLNELRSSMQKQRLTVAKNGEQEFTVKICKTESAEKGQPLHQYQFL